jgi:hypothetical protein
VSFDSGAARSEAHREDLPPKDGYAPLSDRLALSVPIKKPPADEHGGSPNQEANIPVNPLLARHGLVHVVEAEEVMVNDAFEDIECSEPDQHRADQQFG